MGSSMRRSVGVIIIVTLVASCSVLRPLLRGLPPETPPSPDASVPDPSWDAGVAAAPVWLEGGMLRAASTALSDFVARRQYELAGMAEPYPLATCLARPDTYDVQVICEEVDRYVVYILPRPSRCTDAGAFGADATYEIGKTDFRILSADFGE